MLKRSRLEICFDVLRVVMKGVCKPTRIMYSANLSWNSLQDILTSLINQGFLKEEMEENSRRYEITEKGERVLMYYSKALEGLTVETLRPRQ